MKKELTTQERCKRLAEHRTRWTTRRIIGELQVVLARLTAICDDYEQRDYEKFVVQELKGGRYKPSSKQRKSTAIETASKMGL
jgi:hypothetical protein